MNHKINAILECRNIIDKYKNNEIGYGDIFKGMATALAPFDPLFLSLNGLSKNLQAEISFYYTWFCFENENLPKRANWVYGESNEAYGWIDKEKHYQIFFKELQKLSFDTI